MLTLTNLQVQRLGAPRSTQSRSSACHHEFIVSFGRQPSYSYPTPRSFDRRALRSRRQATRLYSSESHSSHAVPSSTTTGPRPPPAVRRASTNISMPAGHLCSRLPQHFRLLQSSTVDCCTSASTSIDPMSELHKYCYCVSESLIFQCSACVLIKTK